MSLHSKSAMQKLDGGHWRSLSCLGLVLHPLLRIEGLHELVRLPRCRSSMLRIRLYNYDVDDDDDDGDACADDDAAAGVGFGGILYYNYNKEPPQKNRFQIFKGPTLLLSL